MIAIRDKNSAIAYLRDPDALSSYAPLKVELEIYSGTKPDNSVISVPCFKIVCHSRPTIFAHIDEDKNPNIISIARSLRDIEIAELKMFLDFHDSIGSQMCEETKYLVSIRRERLVKLVTGKDTES